MHKIKPTTAYAKKYSQPNMIAQRILMDILNPFVLTATTCLPIVQKKILPILNICNPTEIKITVQQRTTPSIKAAIQAINHPKMSHRMFPYF